MNTFSDIKRNITLDRKQKYITRDLFYIIALFDLHIVLNSHWIPCVNMKLNTVEWIPKKLFYIILRTHLANIQIEIPMK